MNPAFILTIVFAAVCLFARCAHATFRVAEVDGEFRQQRNPGYFGLELPIPFHFSVGYDDTTPNSGTSTLGIYETEGAYVTLDFGGFHFWTPNSEIRVYNEPNGIQQGIGFGNEDGWFQYGLYIPPYFCYTFLRNLFFPSPNWDASLHQVADHAGDPAFSWISYTYISGVTVSGAETLLQTSGPITYSVHP